MSGFFSELADVFGLGDSSATKSAENDREAARAGSDADDSSEDEDVVTIVRTSTRTFSPTFDEEIGGFTTFRVDGAPPNSPQPTAFDESGSDDSSSTAGAGQPTDNAGSGPAPTSNQVPAESGTADAASSKSSGGSNIAAKAGIAIGVLAAILIVAGLVWFVFMKRKKKQGERQSLDDDEKLHGPFGNPEDRLTEHAPAPPAKAPRLSLQRLSLFSGGVDKRASKNGQPTFAAAVPASGSASPWERPFTSQSQNPANPFGSHAERMQTPIPEEPMNRSISPLDETNARGPQPVSPMEPQQATFANTAPNHTPNGAAAGAVAAGAAAGATAGLTRSQSRSYGPKPLDLTVAPPMPVSAVPASPALTEYSVNSVTSGQTVPATDGAAAIAAAGGPSTSAVYRVQLDFKPTLEDEVGLRAGDLVRLLHEYDDGWALVIRLDRSQQGVVPRTCLSTRPVKPRPRPGPGPGPTPRGPPVNANGRPMTPQGQPRPGTAQSNRSMSPPHGQRPPQGHGPRPVSPNQTRGPAPAQAPLPGPRYQAVPRPLSPSRPAPKSNPAGPSPIGPNGSPSSSKPQSPTTPSPVQAQPAQPAPAPSAVQAVQAVKAAQAAQAAQAAAAAAAAAQTSQAPAPQPQSQPQPQTQIPQPSPGTQALAQPRPSPPTGPVNRKPVPKAAAE